MPSCSGVLHSYLHIVLPLQPPELSPSDSGLPTTQIPTENPIEASTSFVHRQCKSSSLHPAFSAAGFRQSCTHCGRSATDIVATARPRCPELLIAFSWLTCLSSSKLTELRQQSLNSDCASISMRDVEYLPSYFS